MILVLYLLVSWVQQINRVQVCFLRVLGALLGNNYCNPPILELQLQFNSQSLHLRQQLLNLFLCELVNGANLLEKINFLVSIGTRFPHMFVHAYYPTKFAYNCGLPRLQCLGIQVGTNIHFCREAMQSLRRKVIDELIF